MSLAHRSSSCTTTSVFWFWGSGPIKIMERHIYIVAMSSLQQKPAQYLKVETPLHSVVCLSWRLGEANQEWVCFSELKRGRARWSHTAADWSFRPWVEGYELNKAMTFRVHFSFRLNLLTQGKMFLLLGKLLHSSFPLYPVSSIDVTWDKRPNKQLLCSWVLVAAAQCLGAGQLIHYKMKWYSGFYISFCALKCSCMSFVQTGAALTEAQSNASKESNRLCDELELNDYLSVILARVGMLNTKYDMKGREPRLSHGTHQRADRRLTSSFPLILQESRIGTRSWQCFFTRAVPPPPTHTLWLPPFLSFCDFIFHSIDSGILFSTHSSQLAEKWRPLRISIDVMKSK